MKRKIALIFLIFAILLLPSNVLINGSNYPTTLPIYIQKDAPSQFDRVVFITWDGTRPLWLKTLVENGTLIHAKSVLEAGGYYQPVRITNHDPGTDPGLSTMETGYGPEIHGIYSNQFGPGSEKLAIPDGLTTAERLKATFQNDIKIGYFLPWSFHQINEEYMIQQGNYTDSIFEHIKPGREVDYWFAAENLSWTPDDPESRAATYSGFNEKVQMYYTPLIKSGYLAEKAAEFITNYSSSKFYIRIHFTEPDNVGHGYFESDRDGNITPEYYEALVQCDEATGVVLDALSNAGILDNTLIIIGTDHGFYKETHQGSPWPNNRDDVVEPVFIVSDTSVRPPQEVAIDQMDLSPTILGVLGVNLTTIEPAYVGDQDTGIPMWERIDKEAPVLRNIKYQTNTTEFVDLTNGSVVVNAFNLTIAYTEWSNISVATITINDTTLAANEIGNKNSKWFDIDLTKLGCVDEEEYTISVHLEDLFGYTTTFTVTIKYQYVAEEKRSSFNLLWSLIGVAIVSMPVFWLRRRK